MRVTEYVMLRNAKRPQIHVTLEAPVADKGIDVTVDCAVVIVPSPPEFGAAGFSAVCHGTPEELAAMWHRLTEQLLEAGMEQQLKDVIDPYVERKTDGNG